MEEYKLIIKDEAYHSVIYSLLEATNNDFKPSLTSKFTLEEITKKYIDFAFVYIVFINNEPAGLVTFYVNKSPKDSYLSLIAVKTEFRGLNLGKTLELKCIDYCKSKNSKGIALNMRKSNVKLFNSRIDLGYKVIREYQLENSDESIVDLYLQF